MSIITDSLSISTNQNNYFDGYYCDNQFCTDYPSPISSPNSPDFSEISGCQEGEIKSNNYFQDSCDYCNSPCSTTFNDDIDIDINNTSERSYTTDNTYVPLSPIDSSQYEQTNKISKKRSFDEVEDTDIISNIDTMSDEEIDNYLNNIDLDLFPKVKSSSELLIFSPLAMKRFKLSNKKSNEGEKSNYNCFDLEDDTNTPRIVEITDDEDMYKNISQESSEFSSNINTNTPMYFTPSYSSNNTCFTSPISKSNNFYNYSSSPILSSCQQSA